jgi:hypothetical protein
VTLSKAGYLDADRIAEVKTQIASGPSTALPGREKVIDTGAGQGRPPPSLPKGEQCHWDPSPSLPPRKNEREVSAIPSQEYRWQHMSDYSSDDMLVDSDLDVDPYYHPAKKVLLVRTEFKHLMDKLKLFAGNTTDNFPYGISWSRLISGTRGRNSLLIPI